MTETTATEDQVQSPAQDQSQPAGDVKAQIDAAIKTAMEAQKNEISGLNRRNSELEKQLKEKELATLSEKDRAKAEIELAIQQRDKIIAEAEKLRLDRIKDHAVIGVGLPPDFAKYINGTDEDTVKADAEAFLKLVSDAAEAKHKAFVADKFRGTPPAGGMPPAQDTLQSQYEDAMKKGNMALAVQIKLEAQKQGQIIK